MGTRQREAPAEEEEAPLGSLAHVDLPAGPSDAELESSAKRLVRFEELLAALDGAGLLRRSGLAERLNHVLKMMRLPGHEAAEAVLVRDALASGRLTDLVDSRGRSCRKEAVETLMTCGYPHALDVSPDDLAFARSYVQPASEDEDDEAVDPSSWRGGVPKVRKLGTGLAVAGLALHLVLLTIGGLITSPEAFFSTALAGMGVVIGYGLAHVTRARPTLTPAIFALAGFTALQFLMGLTLGVWGMAATVGLGANVVALANYSHDYRSDEEAKSRGRLF